MHQQAYNRWLEISFFYFCQDILNLNNNIMDVMDFVEAMAVIGKYDIEPIKAAVQEVVMTHTMRPTREEFAILCYRNKVPIHKIKTYLKIGNSTLYNLIDEDKKNPRVFYCRLTEKQLTLIKKFLDTVTIFRKVGIHND